MDHYGGQFPSDGNGDGNQMNWPPAENGNNNNFIPGQQLSNIDPGLLPNNGQGQETPNYLGADFNSSLQDFVANNQDFIGNNNLVNSPTHPQAASSSHQAAPYHHPQAQGQAHYSQPQGQPQYYQSQGPVQYSQPQGQVHYSQPQGQVHYSQPQGQLHHPQPQAQSHVQLALPGPPPPPQPVTSYSAPQTRAHPSRITTPAHPATAVPSRVGTPMTPTPLTATPIELSDEEADLAVLPKGRAKKKEIDYSKVYLATQMPQTPNKFLDRFEYNRLGEWKSHLFFTHQEIEQYMDARKTRRLPLRVWIQNSPAGCTQRGGPDPRTRKCRWDRCPDKNHTILKGFWRVAFDERPDTSGVDTDPFTNAGYMHLWCFERAFDLISMIANFDVRPDLRTLPREVRGKNPMAVDRDHDEMVQTYRDWRRRQVGLYNEWTKVLQNRAEQGIVGNSTRRHREPEDYLWSVLTETHLTLETVGRQGTRDKRGGNSIDKHRGDLQKYTDMVEKRNLENKKKRAKFDAWDKKYAGGRSPSTSPVRRSPRSTKTKRPYVDDEDEDSQFQMQPASKRARGDGSTINTDGTTFGTPRGQIRSSPSTPQRRSPRLLRRTRQDSNFGDAEPEILSEIVVATGPANTGSDDEGGTSRRRSPRIAQQQEPASKHPSPLEGPPPYMSEFPNGFADVEMTEDDFNFADNNASLFGEDGEYPPLP